MANRYADSDFTYCVNKNCKNKCWRYEGNYVFDKNSYYSFTNTCIKEGGKKSEKN